MIREGIDALGGRTTNVDLKAWILKKYPGTNENTIQATTIVCTVNHPSRIHYPENRKPRRATTAHDFLFRPERGKLELYAPEQHGLWAIELADDGKLIVVRSDGETDVEPAGTTDTAAGAQSGLFAEESHLRDYLAQHIEEIEDGLQVYASEEGRDGVEYGTGVGLIDILAVDKNSNLVVIELKVSRGPDAACGQILRYMGWIKRNLAQGRDVRGIIVARHISEKLRYAVADLPNVALKEYELSVAFRDLERI